MINYTTYRLRNFYLLLAVLFSSTAFSQTIITVTDCNLQGWVKQPSANTTLQFTLGPSIPPLGKGSLEYFAPDRSQTRIRSTSYHNTLLSSITEFRYSTFIQSRQTNTDNIYVVLQVDRNNDGLTDDNLIFESRWQTGIWVAGILPDQGPEIPNTWQTWDLLHGGWFAGPPPNPNPEMGGALFSLASYITKYPTAKIVNQNLAGGTGGIRVNFGCPVGYCGGNYKGNADAFTIGINGQTTIYDFEPSVANAGPDHTVVYGYGSNCTTLHGTAAGGVAPYQFSWSAGGNTWTDPDITVCPTTTITYTLTATDKNGCKGTDQVTVFVNDVRCGNKNDKVMVCHKGETICISANAVKAHLQHGDVLGGCTIPASITKADLQVPERLAPETFQIANYPNPFANTTTIQYQLPFDGFVSLKIFDLSGREVSTLVSGSKKAGSHSALVNGNHFNSGVYYYQIIATSGMKIYKKTNKMVVLQ